MYLYYNALLTMLAWWLLAAYLLINSCRIRYLKRVKVKGLHYFPSVTIIVAARNEEKFLQPALESLTRQDYPNYNIIVANDRSSDNTAKIVEEAAQKSPLITALHITRLPNGWLGKCHALYTAANMTNAEWLLFTDADVVFESCALKKAIKHCIENDTEHLAVLPKVKSGSAMVNAVCALFQVLFLLRYSPWQAGDMGAAGYMGVGAFNLVHRTAYRGMGTHAKIAMHPNDDLKLGEYIKAAGYRQAVMYGDDMIGYEWYCSLAEFIDGLTKNAFSSMRYNWWKVALNVPGTLLFFVLPVPFLLLSGDMQLVLTAGLILPAQAVLLLCRKGSQAAWWHVLLIPFSAIVLMYILLRSAWLTLQQKGVYWSHQFYALSELKKFN